MSIQIMLQFNGKSLTIPINPESITISRQADNEDINIIGLGKAVRKGEPGLRTIDIESFFPSSNSYFYTGVLPRTCVEFINTIWNTENKNNNVAKIVTNGLPIDLSMYFVINQFDYDHKAGEEDDIYYRLSIKEYVPYGVKTVDVQLSGLAAARATASAAATVGNINGGGTYVVQSGDCLWNIAKACTGSGSDWSALYELNKSVIGSNPNRIYPGQRLTLPAGWRTPQNVTKLSNVSSSRSSSSSSSNSSNASKSNVTALVQAPQQNPTNPVYVQGTKIPNSQRVVNKTSFGVVSVVQGKNTITPVADRPITHL